jgi:hypothetical protein
MRNYRFIRASIYLLASLALTLTSCGGERGGTQPSNTGSGQVGKTSGISHGTAMMKSIHIMPSNPLGISAGTQLNFTASGVYSDNSVRDVTTMVAWTSSDTSIATVSSEPDSKGLAMAVSKGYCSISATLGNISGSTIIGVN